MNNNPSSLSLKETARLLGRHYHTIWRWVHTGYLPASRMGGAWVVSLKTLKDKFPTHFN